MLGRWGGGGGELPDVAAMAVRVGYRFLRSSIRRCRNAIALAPAQRRGMLGLGFCVRRLRKRNIVGGWRGAEEAGGTDSQLTANLKNKLKCCSKTFRLYCGASFRLIRLMTRQKLQQRLLAACAVFESQSLPRDACGQLSGILA